MVEEDDRDRARSVRGPSPPRLKRARSDESTPEQPICIQKSEFWQEDGNVVLQARNTQFRVHRSMLSNHSPIFKDMFANAAPIGEELMEGCPIVHLSDDPADMHHVLRAIYERGYFSVLEPQTIPTIAALLRLGDKYDMKVLRQDALRILDSDSPLEFPTAPLPGILFSQVLWNDNSAFCFEIVNLLQENGINTLLPVALFLLIVTHNDIEDILRGVCRADGTRVVLHPENLCAAVRGYHNLVKSAEMFLYAWTSTDDCHSPQCMERRLSFMRSVYEGNLILHIEDLCLEWPNDWGAGLCEACIVHGQQGHQAGREKIWEDLPSHFGMKKSWKDLQSEYAMARLQPIPVTACAADLCILL